MCVIQTWPSPCQRDPISGTSIASLTLTRRRQKNANDRAQRLTCDTVMHKAMDCVVKSGFTGHREEYVQTLTREEKQGKGHSLVSDGVSVASVQRLSGRTEQKVGNCFFLVKQYQMKADSKLL